MRPSTYKALLMIADISGFTRFMKSHKDAANHAMPVRVVAELLRAVISAAAPPLKLAEVEGDAAFFYALCNENDEITLDFPAIKKQVMDFFRSFYQILHRLCGLNQCARGAQNLRLKVVIHAGEVALEHIHGFDKLFGMDVILAHRLLKNSVPSKEYILMTESAYNWLGDFHQLEPERQTEYCEGIGVVDTVVFYPPAQPGAVGSIQTAKPQSADWWTKPDEKFHSNTSPFLLSADFLNQARGRSKTPLNDYLLSEPFHHSARAQPFETVWLCQLQSQRRRDYELHVGGQGRQELRCGSSPFWRQAGLDWR
jgi:class 3 adenylate cyclase